ncbi:putative receptor protein kinase ZmPK1 [Hordeum vulgare]|nr:putative receptor protein kinase ZmPK1 [Hordeum vulgare]
MVDLTQPPLPADLVFPWLHGVTDDLGSGWRHAGAPVKPCAPFWKLPNATMAKKGKVSEKKNKAADGSSRQPKKRLAGHAKDAAATEAPASSLAASAADAHNVFDEMPSSFNDETYMSTMGVGSNNSHWSQTNEVHFDDHEFEVDEDGEGIVGATKGRAGNYTMDEDVLLWRVAAKDRKVALEEKKLAMEGRTWLLEWKKYLIFMDTSTLDEKRKEYVKLASEEVLVQKEAWEAWVASELHGRHRRHGWLRSYNGRMGGMAGFGATIDDMRVFGAIMEA